MKDLHSHIIRSGATMMEALQRLNALSGDAMTLFVCRETDGTMLGTLTDGDIRRALLHGADINNPVDTAMNTAFLCIRREEEKFARVREARRKHINLLPRLDDEGRILSVVDLQRIKDLIPADAILMAGGRGERLRPMTDTCPKPLLEIGGKAIIDYNVEELFANGVENVIVSVNYLKEQIIDHFQEARFHGAVSCIAETQRLGTLGSVALAVDSLRNEHLFVMNSDLLTAIRFGDMYEAHISSGAALTMAVVPYSVSIPFAIVESDEGRVTSLKEKPVHNYFANAGVYIMKRDIALRIPKHQYLDAPDFINTLIERGEKVGYFPIDGTWIDIGNPDDFRNAQKIMSKRHG